MNHSILQKGLTQRNTGSFSTSVFFATRWFCRSKAHSFPNIKTFAGWKFRPHPYDTTTLNYNWQIWETNTFSLYTRATEFIDEQSAEEAVDSILRFLAKLDMIHEENIPPGVQTQKLDEKNLVTIHNKVAGILLRRRGPGDKVARGETIALIIDPYTSGVREEIRATSDGVIFFSRHAQILPSHTVVFRIISQISDMG